MEKQKVYEILNNIKKKKQKLSLWTYKYDKLVDLDVWIDELNPQDLKIAFLTNRKKVADAIIGSNENAFFYSPDLKIAFSSKIINLVNNELKINFPFRSEIIEVRTNSRIDLDLKIQMKLKNKIYSFNTFDVGYNGISVIVKEGQKSLFKKDLEISECLIHFADHKIKLGAVVRNIIKMNAYEFKDIPFTFYRVGMEFIEIDERQKAFIKRVIDVKKNVG